MGPVREGLLRQSKLGLMLLFHFQSQNEKLEGQVIKSWVSHVWAYQSLGKVTINLEGLVGFGECDLMLNILKLLRPNRDDDLINELTTVRRICCFQQRKKASPSYCYSS